MAVIPGLVEDVEGLLVGFLKPSAHFMFLWTCKRALQKYKNHKFKGNGGIISILADGFVELADYYFDNIGIVHSQEFDKILSALKPFDVKSNLIWSIKSLKYVKKLWPKLHSRDDYKNFLFHFGAAITVANYKSLHREIETWAHQQINEVERAFEYMDAFYRGLCHADVFKEVYESHKEFYYEVDPTLWRYAIQFDALETFHHLFGCDIVASILGMENNEEYAYYFIKKFHEAEFVSGTKILNFLMKTYFRELEPDTRDGVYEKLYSEMSFQSFGKLGNVDIMDYLSRFPFENFGVDKDKVDSYYTVAFIHNAINRPNKSFLNWMIREKKVDEKDYLSGALFPRAIEAMVASIPLDPFEKGRRWLTFKESFEFILSNFNPKKYLLAFTEVPQTLQRDLNHLQNAYHSLAPIISNLLSPP